MLLNILHGDPDNYDMRFEALNSLQTVLKEAGGFPTEVREFMETLELPPEPPDPKILAEIERKRAEEEAKENERLRLEEEAEAAKAAKEAAKEAAKNAKMNGHAEKPKNPKLEALTPENGAGSRRGSASSVVLGGMERRGSYYGDDVSKKATVAMVVDDPDSKKNINALLDEGRP